jgi:uncharacterized protein (DUF488 family)
MAFTRIYSIGFAGHRAEDFFGALRSHGIQRLVDVRLRPTSQLAGFAKAADLAWFLKELCGAEYAHEPLLTPTPEILDAYRKKAIGWDEYAERFLGLMEERHVETTVAASSFEIPTVFLCSEHAPDRCHRRLALEYLAERWGADLEIVHL